jgi:hypothetical protein
MTGLASTPHRNPSLHRTVPSQLSVEPAALLLAASNPRAQHVLSLTSTDLLPHLVLERPVKTEMGQPAYSEATLLTKSLVTARQAQDALFAWWDDGTRDLLAWKEWR